MADLPIKIRRVRAGDIRKLREMMHALAEHHGETPLVRDEHLSRDVLGRHPWVTVIVAEVEIAVVGYAALLPLAKLQDGVRGMEMAHLFVTESMRGQGVGRALIGACQAEARERNCASITVRASADNAAAQAVYRAAGFGDAPRSGVRFRKAI